MCCGVLGLSLQYCVGVQKVGCQRAATALKLAMQPLHEEEHQSTDADVQAESAAMQHRCRQWITAQDELSRHARQQQQKAQGRAKQPLPGQNTEHQPQLQQGSAQQPCTECHASMQPISGSGRCDIAAHNHTSSAALDHNLGFPHTSLCSAANSVADNHSLARNGSLQKTSSLTRQDLLLASEGQQPVSYDTQEAAGTAKEASLTDER